MKCVLGFDGGGTKTECVVMNETGKIVGRATGPASNPTRVGFPSAIAAVAEAANLAIRSVEAPLDIAALCAGLAGTGRVENRMQMRELLESRFPGVVIDVRTDLELPLSTMPAGAAIVLVVGTGSAAIGRSAGGTIQRVGGLGPAASDEGSAFDIGRAAVSTARFAETTESAELSRQILRHLGTANWDELDSIAAAHADAVYPRVFPVIAAAADSGNQLAQSLLHAAAEKLSSMASHLAEELNLLQQIFPLGKYGGTIGRSRFFDAALDSQLLRKLPRASVMALDIDSAAAAARIALQLYLTPEAFKP